VSQWGLTTVLRSTEDVRQAQSSRSRRSLSYWLITCAALY